MTQNFNEDALLPFPPNETSSDKSDAAPKRVAKKAAKKAAKKVAAKAAEPEPSEVKPSVAKKAAKKAAKKVIEAEAPAPTAEAPAKKAAKKAASRTAKVVPEPSTEAPLKSKPTARVKAVIEAPPEPVREREERPEPRQAPPSPQVPSEEGQQQRFGRVPGGGRVQHRSPDGPPREPQQPQAHQPREQGAQGQHPTQRHPQQQPQGQGGQQESRSKRRREKRKRRRERQFSNDQPRPEGENQAPGPRPGPPHPRQQQEHVERRPMPPQFSGPKVEVNGMLELAPKGFGFLRLPAKRFEQARDDVFVSPEHVRKFGLRVGHWIHGIAQEGPRGPQLIEITSVNGIDPEISRKLPLFEELKAINPTKRISFETTPERFTTRVVDLMSPVGRGQRGLIVSPPRSGKTTLLLHMAEAIREKYEETMHLMIVLVDERPEEVTEFRRALPGVEIYASSNDDGSRNHCRIAELAIERAKRLVEGGKDVFLLMDSITRLARAYNHGGGGGHNRGIASGGLMVGALEIPRRLFAAARNTRGGGSLTILATALIQTNSKADEAIFQEFKGTGNMELVLDRKIAENYIYPAVDIFKSGTRREELLLPEHMLHKIYLIRRGLSGHRPVEAMERLLFFLKKFPNNPQMLMEIKG
jgi:transcription termination factor Rho